MKKSIAGAFLVSVALLLPQVSVAGVYMCVDPATGKKTFTDRACPSAGTGKKVRVEPTNFGKGVAKREIPADGIRTSLPDLATFEPESVEPKPRPRK